MISYNPGYQSVTKELKESTRQRFITIGFDYPAPEVEVEIVQRESGCSAEVAERLVQLAQGTRKLRSHGLAEGASTRVLVYAGALSRAGLPLKAACEATLVGSLTDDAEMAEALRELIRSVLGD